MKRVLITGASGFAGGYLMRACAEAGEEVVGVSRSGRVPAGTGEGRAVDLCDQTAVRSILRKARPDVVYHLASLSSVGRSWEDPTGTVEDNVASSVNMLEGLRLEAPGARVVWVSSLRVGQVTRDVSCRTCRRNSAGLVRAIWGIRLGGATITPSGCPFQRVNEFVGSALYQRAWTRVGPKRHPRAAGCIAASKRFGYTFDFIEMEGWQEWRGSNPQPPVLETGALPIELHSYP